MLDKNQHFFFSNIVRSYTNLHLGKGDVGYKSSPKLYVPNSRVKPEISKLGESKKCQLQTGNKNHICTTVQRINGVVIIAD